MTPRMSRQTAYLAPLGFLESLLEELSDVQEVHDRLVVAEGPAQDVLWVDNIWHDLERFPHESIGKTAKALRSKQRNWAHFPLAHHRRCALIQEKLPHVSARPLAFGDAAPKAALGSWTLTESGEVWASPRCTRAFPHGQVHFIEDKEVPPNRAYLKLWEVFTLLGKKPGVGDHCLDLGSCPGGWTWVLQGLGARVLSVDKAPLERGIDLLPRVEFRQQSAFALEPSEVTPVDWLFCDIACYPQRLLSLVRKWLDSGRCRNFVCTIKLQGACDFEDIQPFRAIEGSRVCHLWHNKNELTWIRLEPSSSG